MNAIFTILNPNNTVTINRLLAHAIGLNEAIIFAALAAKQSYYAERDMLDDGGFFYSTVADLEESTALTRHQQSAAIKNLVELGLIESCKRGMPARRCFKVNEDVSLLESFLRKGEKKMIALNPLANSSPKSGEQESEKSGDLCAENRSASQPKSGIYTYNLNNKSEIKNPYQSIDRTDVPDLIDRINVSSRSVVSSEERDEYLELTRENIDYDVIDEKKQVDELVEIMLDVVCSSKPTIRVNGDELPQEVVKSRFLKLDSAHIDYVLMAMRNNTSKVKNIRSYLITALYNAPTTMESYYAAWVNHDMSRRE